MDVFWENQVPPEWAGKRLDRMLSALLPHLSRSLVQRHIKAGYVLVEGQPARPAEKVEAGQRVTWLALVSEPLTLQPEAMPLQIVYEDEDLLVINKPPELVVHPGKGHLSGTLVNALLAYCQLSRRGEAIRPGIVHRLDQHTSGLLLVAKTDQAHAELSRQVEERKVRREYLALVWGHPTPSEGIIRTGFSRHPRHRTIMTARPWGQGRPAITEYRTQERYQWLWRPGGAERPRQRHAALLECVLHTGRTHQIRVHMQHIGHPILNDPVYGDPARDAEEPPELRRLLEAIPGQALHAGKLVFCHPQTQEEISLQADPPSGFQALLDWLRKEALC